MCMYENSNQGYVVKQFYETVLHNETADLLNIIAT